MFGLSPIDHSKMPAMTEVDAHRILQDHMDCSITACPVKLQAKTLLVHIGKLVPRTNSRTRMGF